MGTCLTCFGKVVGRFCWRCGEYFLTQVWEACGAIWGAMKCFEGVARRIGPNENI